jgi:hypothetical protein
MNRTPEIDTMMGTPDFAKLVPGFDFLKGLMAPAGGAGAAAGLPGFGQWVAPTLDPAELDKRINDLRTVQFWLEQNARLIAATVQALEVQRMTLSTLQTMNLPLADLREALTIKPPPASASPSPAPPAPEPAPAPARAKKEKAAPPAAAPAVDPMQWWGALTQQFAEIASKALQDGAAAATPAKAAPPAADAQGKPAPAAKPRAAARKAKG